MEHKSAGKELQSPDQEKKKTPVFRSCAQPWCNVTGGICRGTAQTIERVVLANGQRCSPRDRVLCLGTARNRVGIGLALEKSVSAAFKTDQ